MGTVSIIYIPHLKMSKKNTKPAAHNLPWTKMDDSDLRQWYKQGHANKLIADWLDRSEASIEYRIAKLGLKGKVAKIAKAAKANKKAKKVVAPVAPLNSQDIADSWNEFDKLPNGSKLQIVKRGFEAVITFTRGAKQHVIGWLRRTF